MRLLLQLLGWCQCCRCYFRRSVLMHQWRRLSMAITIQINRHRIYKGYHKMIKHEPALFRIQQSVEAEKVMQTQEQTRSSRSKQPRATRFCSCISRRTSPPQKHVLRTRMLLDATIYNIYSYATYQLSRVVLWSLNFYQFLALFVSSVELKMGRSAKTLHSNYNESVASGCINMTPMTQWHAVENKQTQFNL